MRSAGFILWLQKNWEPLPSEAYWSGTRLLGKDVRERDAAKTTRHHGQWLSSITQHIAPVQKHRPWEPKTTKVIYRTLQKVIPPSCYRTPHHRSFLSEWAGVPRLAKGVFWLHCKMHSLALFRTVTEKTEATTGVLQLGGPLLSFGPRDIRNFRNLEPG